MVAATPGRVLKGAPPSAGSVDGAGSYVNSMSVSETSSMVEGAAYANDGAQTRLATAGGVDMAQHATKTAVTGQWSNWGRRMLLDVSAKLTPRM